MILPAVLLILALAIVAHSGLRGHRFGARAAALGDTLSRPRMLLIWAASLYASYALSTQLGLIVLDRVEAIFTMPGELAVARLWLGLRPEEDGFPLLILGASMIGGTVIGGGLALLLRKRARPPPALTKRSIAVARSPREALPAALLSLSAGLSEELFFRLFLPLLVAIVFGVPIAGFVIGLAAFALVHRYQGWVGMLSATIVGAVLTLFYLLTGTLWAPIALHAYIDISALILRPMLAGRWRPQTGD